MIDRAMQVGEAGRYWSYSVDRRIEPAEPAAPLRFGRFLVQPAARSLLCDGAPVEIGGRAFDLLVVLLRSRGEIVTKDEISRQVWPSTIVEESNLRFQMTMLRKALGNERERIKTVTGRGYLFVADEVPAGDVDPGDRAARPVPPPRDDQAAAKSPQKGKPALIIIDEDQQMSAMLHRLLRRLDLPVRFFASVQAFLESDASAAAARRPALQPRGRVNPAPIAGPAGTAPSRFGSRHLTRPSAN